MSARPALLAATAGLLAGVAIGCWLTGAGPERAPAAGSSVSGDAAARLAELQAAHDTLLAKHEALRAERQRVAAEPAHRLSEAEPAVEPPLRGRDPAISFGDWRHDPALRTADWKDMGRRAFDVVEARKAGIGGGRPPEMAALENKAIRELRRHVGRIEAANSRLSGHPIVVVNLMASHLRTAGQPFDARQVDAIAAAGQRYEADAATLRRALDVQADVLASERKLRDIQLRKTHVDAIVADVLTRAQWNVLFDSQTKGLLYYDVYQVGGLELERPNSSVYWRNVRTDATRHLQLFLRTEWEVPREDLARLGPLVDAWIDAIAALPRHAGHPTSALHVDEVLPCAEVHVRFQQRVCTALAHDPETARRIHANPVFVVFPRLRGRS